MVAASIPQRQAGNRVLWHYRCIRVRRRKFHAVEHRRLEHAAEPNERSGSDPVRSPGPIPLDGPGGFFCPSSHPIFPSRFDIPLVALLTTFLPTIGRIRVGAGTQPTMSQLFIT